MSDNIKRFTFRIPASLYDKVEQLAKNNYRSINAEVVKAVEEYVKKHENNSAK